MSIYFTYHRVQVEEVSLTAAEHGIVGRTVLPSFFLPALTLILNCYSVRCHGLSLRILSI
ncbi:hypothetical protein AR540_21720 [Pseudomonas sp. EpS/L25]|nr:hypothetical protein AR540_21720 [Pseudomonas sp. EpS/L25]